MILKKQVWRRLRVGETCVADPKIQGRCCPPVFVTVSELEIKFEKAGMPGEFDVASEPTTENVPIVKLTPRSVPPDAVVASFV